MRLLYIDRGRQSPSISEWHKILKEIVEGMGGILDTLIIGKKLGDIVPTLAVPPPDHPFSPFLQTDNWFERYMLSFDSVIRGLKKLFMTRTYDGIITGNTSFMVPLYALGLMNISGFITHDQGVELKGRVHPVLAAMLEFGGGHVLPLLEGLKQFYLRETNINENKIHVTPIPAQLPTKEIVTKVIYDFSTVISGFPWDNVPLLEKLTRQGGKWLVKTYGKIDIPEFKGDVTVVKEFLPLDDYYKLLGSAKVGVQVQLRENCCKAIAEHAMFHPIMVFEGANYLMDCEDFAISFNENNFLEKARPLLEDPLLRRNYTLRGKEIVAERFSYDSMKRGLHHFLDSIKPDPPKESNKALKLVRRLISENRAMGQHRFLEELRWTGLFVSQKTLRRLPRNDIPSMTYFGSAEDEPTLERYFK